MTILWAGEVYEDIEAPEYDVYPEEDEEEEEVETDFDYPEYDDADYPDFDPYSGCEVFESYDASDFFD